MTYTDVGKPLVYCALPALHLGLGLIGVPSRLSFGDRALECAIAYLFSYSTGFVAKRVFSSVRPDGSDARSFPSGHSSLGFTGATLICIDYGPLVAAVPYFVCGFTMAERLWGDRHWLGDLFAGAGLGILCAHAGQWLVGPVKSLFGLPEWTWDGLGGRRGEFALLPSADPFSGTPMMSFSLRF